MRSCTIALSALLAACTAAAADYRTLGLETLQTIEERYRLPNGTYRERLPPGEGFAGGPSTCWAAGVQLSALNAAARVDPKRLDGALAYIRALDNYLGRDAQGRPAYQPYPGGIAPDVYYDDNAWLVLQFLETAKLVPEKDAQALVDKARLIYKFVMSGESEVLGGGLFWRADKLETKNACSNGPAICGALELFRITGEKSYLVDAQRLYAWNNANLQDTNGLFWDLKRVADGSIDKAMWSYNSALMVRANGLFYEVTREQRYLDEARRVAAAAESFWIRPEDGAIKDEASFAHLFTESLLYLSTLDGDAERVAKVKRGLDVLATLKRNELYPKRWDGWREDERFTELLTQASAARAFLFAAAHEQAIPATQPVKR